MNSTKNLNLDFFFLGGGGGGEEGHVLKPSPKQFGGACTEAQNSLPYWREGGGGVRVKRVSAA